MSTGSVRRGVLVGLLAASLSAQAVPAPPTWEKRAAGADVIVLGDVREWKRTSWFWQSERSYEGQLHVERVLKGSVPGSDVVLRVRSHSGGAVGGDLDGEPRTGHFAFFLVRSPDGSFTLASPQVHAFQLLSADELGMLEAALRAAGRGG